MSSGATSFYVTGGTLRLDAQCYVERQADRDLLDGLITGEFCYVLTSRQMGKSSLMVRTANKLRASGVSVLVLDLSAVGQNVTQEQWYNGLLATIADQLGVEDELDEIWRTPHALGPVQRWFNILGNITLSRTDPLVVFIDEIDVVRSLPFSTDEFFAGIRECYNRRAANSKFNRLTFCLLGVATPSDLVRNTSITPFNIGRRIDLDDFTEREALPLARGLHTDSPSATKVLRRVLYWTSGHPYLTQRLCLALARDLLNEAPGDVDQRCEELFLSSRGRERDDNLIFVRERLLRSDADLTDLLELYLKSWSRKSTLVDEGSPLVSVLRLSGIVRADGGRLVERNRIYHQVFDKSWVKANLPGAELRRQRAAFHRGVLRTTAIAAIVLFAMTLMVLITADRAKKARVALSEAYFSKAQAKRGSGSSGQRYDSVRALEEASRYFTNRGALRDELIACLALPDLKENHGLSHPGHGRELHELNWERGVCASQGAHGTIVIRTIDHSQVVSSIAGIGSPIKRLRFGSDPNVLLAEYEERPSAQTVIWDWSKEQQFFTVPHGIHAEAIDFSADGKRLAIGQKSGQITVYSLPEGKILFQKKPKLGSGRPRIPQVLRFAPSGEYLAEACPDDLYVKVWNLKTPRNRAELAFFHPDRVYDLSWHSGGEILATACGDSAIYLWNIDRPDRPVKKLLGHEGPVSRVSFNHRGTLLASCGRDETIRLWTPATERHLVCPVDGESFTRLQFNADDTELIASDGSASHRLWDVMGGEYAVLEVPAGPFDALRSLDFSPDGRWLAATSGERATIWNSASGAEYGFLKMTNAHAAGFSFDSRSLIASTDDGLFRYSLSSIAARDEPVSASRLALTGEEKDFGTMALVFDRTSAVMMSTTNVLRVPLATNQPPAPCHFPLGKHYQRLAIHPAGMWLAATSAGTDSIDIWNLSGSSAGQIATLRGNEYFSFSPDGNWLATCWDGAFRFYRAGHWNNVAFSIPRERISSQHAPVAFVADGSMVAVALTRYSIQLLRLPRNGLSEAKVVATLTSPDRDPLEILAFSQDGRGLAAGTANFTVQVWNLALLRAQLARLKLENNWPEYQ